MPPFYAIHEPPVPKSTCTHLSFQGFEGRGLRLNSGKEVRNVYTSPRAKLDGNINIYSVLSNEQDLLSDKHCDAQTALPDMDRLDDDKEAQDHWNRMKDLDNNPNWYDSPSDPNASGRRLGVDEERPNHTWAEICKDITPGVHLNKDDHPGDQAGDSGVNISELAVQQKSWAKVADIQPFLVDRNIRRKQGRRRKVMNKWLDKVTATSAHEDGTKENAVETDANLLAIYEAEEKPVSTSTEICADLIAGIDLNKDDHSLNHVDWPSLGAFQVVHHNTNRNKMARKWKEQREQTSRAVDAWLDNVEARFAVENAEREEAEKKAAVAAAIEKAEREKAAAIEKAERVEAAKKAAATAKAKKEEAAKKAARQTSRGVNQWLDNVEARFAAEKAEREEAAKKAAVAAAIEKAEREEAAKKAAIAAAIEKAEKEEAAKKAAIAAAIEKARKQEAARKAAVAAAIANLPVAWKTEGFCGL